MTSVLELLNHLTIEAIYINVSSASYSGLLNLFLFAHSMDSGSEQSGVEVSENPSYPDDAQGGDKRGTTTFRWHRLNRPTFKQHHNPPRIVQARVDASADLPRLEKYQQELSTITRKLISEVPGGKQLRSEIGGEDKPRCTVSTPSRCSSCGKKGSCVGRACAHIIFWAENYIDQSPDRPTKC